MGEVVVAWLGGLYIHRVWQDRIEEEFSSTGEPTIQYHLEEKLIF